jgi:hypothetical protein
MNTSFGVQTTGNAYTPAHSHRSTHTRNWRAVLTACLFGLLITNPAAFAGPNHLWVFNPSAPAYPAFGDQNRIGPQSRSTPAVGLDGNIYVIGDDQRLRAITPGPSGGTLAWRANTMATTDSFSPENAPSVASDGTIWTAISFFEEVPGGITISNRIYAIKPDGAVAFDYEMSTPKILIGAPAIDVNDWAFYVYHDCLAAFGRSGSSYGYKFSLTVPSGTRKIATMPAISTPSYGTDGNGAYTNQLVYWAENPSSQIGRVYALRLKQYANGTHATSQAWTPWSFPGGTSESAIQHLALGSDNSIYVTTKVGSSTHKLHKLNGNTGAHLWTANLTFQPNTSPVLGVDGTVYFGGVVSDIQGNFSYGVYKVHPTTQAVTLFAATTHPVKGAPLVDVTGKIYAAYDGGSTANFRCFNPSGSVAWTESYSGNWGQTAPVMDRKGRIYMLRTAGTTEGDLIALKGSGRPAFSDCRCGAGASAATAAPARPGGSWSSTPWGVLTAWPRASARMAASWAVPTATRVFIWEPTLCRARTGGGGCF